MALASNLIKDLPSALADASSRMPEPCRRAIADDLAGIFTALESFDGAAPFAGVARDSLDAAIAPLSRRYPDGEKILYYGILVAIDQYDHVLRTRNSVLADSLAVKRTRIRLATIEPTENSHVNKYLALASARLDQLHDLLHAMLDRTGGTAPCSEVSLPSLTDVATVDDACDYLHRYLAVLRQAADRAVASCSH